LDFPSVTVVIPVYNSAPIVGTTVQRVRTSLETMGGDMEIILVNDGSMDESWQVISELARTYPFITAINLLKNYGQHTANLCGFREATGDYIVTLDDDLQNPPEEMGKLIAKALQGYDLVIGCFKTKKHSLVRRWGSRIVGTLNRVVFDLPDDLILTNYRVIHRDVITRICKGRHLSPYIPGLLLKYSLRRANVLVEHHSRRVGTSSYTLRKLLSLVATLLFNHSSLPLRFSAALGFVIAFFSLMFGGYHMLEALRKGTGIPGWASLMVSMSFLNGVLILLISVIGEYLIRVLREVSPAQPYEIAELIRR
jgi:polyisoprenyl-phosphate glycosyltransferase